MDLDPFTTLGLAGNTVQFLDFASKLVSGTWAIYRSAESISDKNHDLQTIAKDIHKLSDRLTISTARGTTVVGQNLRRIAFECQKVAEDLLHVLNTLQNNGKRSMWKSFLLALQEVWKQREIFEP